MAKVMRNVGAKLRGLSSYTKVVLVLCVINIGLIVYLSNAIKVNEEVKENEIGVIEADNSVVSAVPDGSMEVTEINNNSQQPSSVDSNGVNQQLLSVDSNGVNQQSTSGEDNVINNRGVTTSLTEEELAIFVAIIYCEVGAESYETKLGVANVVINRIYDKRYPNNLKDVVYDPYQFSPVREGKLEKQLAIYKAGGFTTNNHKQCMQAAQEAMAGHNNVGDRIGFLTPDYLEKLFAGKYRDKLVIGKVAFFNV